MMYRTVLGLFLCALFISSCGKTEDDEGISFSKITGKYWYRNQWQGSPGFFTLEDHITAIKLDANGKAYELNCGGREINQIGTWKGTGNSLVIIRDKAELGFREEKWSVLRATDKELEIIVNNQKVVLENEPDNIKGLMVDAFFVTEYRSNEGMANYVDVRVSGKTSIREGLFIIDDKTNYKLINRGTYWGMDRKTVQLSVPDEPRNVKFYLRIGHSYNVKFIDQLYNTTIPERQPSEMNITASNNGGASTLAVGWVPYEEDDVYYRVEVLDMNRDVINPYFVSVLQQPGASSLIIDEGTAGEKNRIVDLKTGTNYILRISAILYEPGIDPMNRTYGEGNKQAVTYFEKQLIWE
ncbi:MAG: hypothetical protein ACRDDZ_00795 [Marinifilaceae bacterium]